MPWRGMNTRAAVYTSTGKAMYKKTISFTDIKLCGFKQRTANERRRINAARNRDQAQLNTFVVRPCPPTDQRRRARGL